MFKVKIINQLMLKVKIKTKTNKLIYYTTWIFIFRSFEKKWLSMWSLFQSIIWFKSLCNTQTYPISVIMFEEWTHCAFKLYLLCLWFTSA